MLIGIFSGLLAISIVANVLMYKYAKHLINKLQQFSENINDLKDLLGVYSQHLDNTYNAPTFYGDSTLQSLLTHTKEIINDIKEFNEAFLIEQERKDEEGR
jgi:hypothetical protein